MAVLVQQQLAADAAFVLHTRSPLGGDGALLAEVALGMGETLAAGTRGSPWRLSVDKASGARAARRRGPAHGAQAAGGLWGIAPAVAGARVSRHAGRACGRERLAGPLVTGCAGRRMRTLCTLQTGPAAAPRHCAAPDALHAPAAWRGLSARYCGLSARARPPGAVDTLAFANFSAALRAGAGGGASGFAYAARTPDYSAEALTVDAGARAALGGRLAGVGAALERAFGGPQDVEGALVGGRLFVVQTRPQP